MMHFIETLRNRSGGKPTGFKICIGRPSEFLGICKALLETEIYPDFIVIDGAEGGTGAGPIEFLDHMGTPLTEGLLFAHNSLVGSGLRDKVRLGCSAKIVTAFGIASKMATGADWCNSARGFMFAVGCIQAQRCHTNTCPVGVATQDHKRQKGLVVPDKAERVYNFHRNTLDALAQVVAAAGLDHPNQLKPIHMCRRVSPTVVRSYEDLYDYLEPNELLEGSDNALYRKYWDRANACAFCGPNHV
jgi:glutamate synthase domain-containing protein 2